MAYAARESVSLKEYSSVVQEKPSRVLKAVEKPRTRLKENPRIKISHVVLLAVLLMVLGTQFVMAKTSLNGLHYEVETLEVMSNRLESENDAHYQHLSELSQMSRLKEIVNAEGLKLDHNRVFRLDVK